MSVGSGTKETIGTRGTTSVPRVFILCTFTFALALCSLQPLTEMLGVLMLFLFNDSLEEMVRPIG